MVEHSGKYSDCSETATPVAVYNGQAALGCTHSVWILKIVALSVIARNCSYLSFNKRCVCVWGGMFCFVLNGNSIP